jgi:hypothetical protein
MSTNLARPVSRPWQRFLRFSVRVMTVLVIVIGAGLGWIVRSAQVQREAVAAIEKAGGEVEYAWGWAPMGRIPPPEWLMSLIGDDYFGHAIDVRLSPSSTPADSTIVQIGRLTQLQRLWLDSTAVGDAGLVHLKGLTSLEFLGLSAAQVTDAGLVHVEGLTSLKYLSIIDTQVTDAGLVHLKGLMKLELLVVNGTQFTDAGVNELKQALPSLTIYR